MCRIFAACFTAWSISGFFAPASFRPNAMLSYSVMCGYSAYDWNTIAMPRFALGTSLTFAPSISRSPLEMSSRPAIIRISVDLPQPLGPTNTTNSPSAMSRFTLRSTSVSS